MARGGRSLRRPHGARCAGGNSTAEKVRCSSQCRDPGADLWLACRCMPSTIGHYVALDGQVIRPFSRYDELVARDKANLDVAWLATSRWKTRPTCRAGVLAAEIVEELEAALAQFAELASSLPVEGPSRPMLRLQMLIRQGESEALRRSVDSGLTPPPRPPHRLANSAATGHRTPDTVPSRCGHESVRGPRSRPAGRAREPPELDGAARGPAGVGGGTTGATEALRTLRIACPSQERRGGLGRTQGAVALAVYDVTICTQDRDEGEAGLTLHSSPAAPVHSNGDQAASGSTAISTASSSQAAASASVRSAGFGCPGRSSSSAC